MLVEALHRMSGESGSGWDENECRSAVRSYERTVEAIEGGHSDEARSILAKSLAAALRHWERKAPDELKQSVAWFASDRWLEMTAPTRAKSTRLSASERTGRRRRVARANLP